MGDLVIFFGKNLFSMPNLRTVVKGDSYFSVCMYSCLSLLTHCKILDVVSLLHCLNYPTAKRHMDLP